MRAIGIDIGTTSISGVVFETGSGPAHASGEHSGAKVLMSETIPGGADIAPAHDWEKTQDPAVIVSKAEALLDRLIDRCGEPAGIGLTGQMHGIVYVDAGGRAVSPLYTWQDQRGSLKENGRSTAERAAAAYGRPAAPGYGLVTHIYNLEHGLVPETAVTFCTIMDYLGMQLTGRTSPLVHANNAASFGFWDIPGERFDEAALVKAAAGSGTSGKGILSFLPEVTSGNEVIGEFRGIPVTVAIGDNQASFIGAAGAEEHTLLINVGTGGQVSMAGSSGLGGTSALTELRPFINHRCLLVGATLCGGRAYAILERFFRSYSREITGEDSSQYEVMERLARAELEHEAGRDIPRTVTAFGGTRADPGARGSITGISEENFLPGRLILSVMEGMISELKELYDEMLRRGAEPAVRAVVSGNGMRRNALLREITAGIFEMPAALSPYEEEAACGAAVFSLRSLTRI